jgi:hypothetical protein
MNAIWKETPENAMHVGLDERHIWRLDLRIGVVHPSVSTEQVTACSK